MCRIAHSSIDMHIVCRNVMLNAYYMILRNESIIIAVMRHGHVVRLTFDFDRLTDVIISFVSSISSLIIMIMVDYSGRHRIVSVYLSTSSIIPRLNRLMTRPTLTAAESDFVQPNNLYSR